MRKKKNKRNINDNIASTSIKQDQFLILFKKKEKNSTVNAKKKKETKITLKS